MSDRQKPGPFARFTAGPTVTFSGDFLDKLILHVTTTPATIQRERKGAHHWLMYMGWSGGRSHGKTGIVDSVSGMISDVHSPMDCWPRHAMWELIY